MLTLVENNPGSGRVVATRCTAAPDPNASDEALIAAIASGDQRAMGLLYARHSVRVYRFALRLVGNDATAEDIASEVFLDVWRKAKSFEGRSHVSTWLLGITRNKAREILRRPSIAATDRKACDAIADEADDPEAAMEKRQTGSIVFKCLKSLSPVHREIVDLVYYHQKSVNEVAEIIGIPRNTVKTRMFYARAHLSKLLAEAGLEKALLAA
jgi:RNA polymerase sigma-70 factor, ECF subfamily